MKNLFKKFFIFAVIMPLLVVSVNAQFKPGSCKNPNGETYCGSGNGAAECYCDNVCTDYKDCCMDYKQTCATAEGSDGGGGGNGKCAVEGKFCGGIAGVDCCGDLTCSYSAEKPAPDAGGICVQSKPEVQKCTDSDGGLNYNLKGSVKGILGGQPYEWTDSCCTYQVSSDGGPGCSNTLSTSDYLNEYYCESNNPTANNYKCPNGCKDGACNSLSSSLKIISPNGGETLIRGETYTIKWENPDKIGPFDMWLVQNGKVESIGFALGTSSTSTWTVGTVEGSSYIPDGDYKIRISNQKGTIFDESDSTFKIVTKSQQCTDSDGGLSYNVKGTATGDYQGNSGTAYICGANNDPACYPRTDGISYTTYYDICANKNQLNEGYCLEDGKLWGYGYFCPNGCKDGACISGNEQKITKQEIKNWINNNCANK